jgi:hypothetical protein
MNCQHIIELATEHLDRRIESQALFCLQNAIKYRDSGWFKEARKWAILSLDLSINHHKGETP